MTRAIILLLLIINFSCENNHSTDIKSDSQVETDSQKEIWELLKIRVDNELFYVSTNQDTCYYFPPVNQEELKKPIGDQKRVSKKIILSKIERDTLISLALDAISNPKMTDQQVSCYAGQYVTISLKGNSTTITCEYSSISDWTKISSTLNKINDLTFEKVKSNKLSLSSSQNAE
jgi:hypothetical protein